MATHKSAWKRVRQTARRTAVNRRNMGRLRTQIKSLRKIIASGNGSDAQTVLTQTLSVIDRSVTKGVIHRNTADRYKSRLTKRVSALGKKP
ncbi:MAG: 30S ribosomal protein S20 [Acidobacteriia bacterium]|nr:30S ribosomal protein S20 [Terriglobia bacterium]